MVAGRGDRRIMAAIEDFLDNLYQTNSSSGEDPNEIRTRSEPGFLGGDVFAGAHLGPFMEMGDQLSNPWPADVAVNFRPRPLPSWFFDELFVHSAPRVRHRVLSVFFFFTLFVGGRPGTELDWPGTGGFLASGGDEAARARPGNNLGGCKYFPGVTPLSHPNLYWAANHPTISGWPERPSLVNGPLCKCSRASDLAGGGKPSIAGQFDMASTDLKFWEHVAAQPCTGASPAPAPDTELAIAGESGSNARCGEGSGWWWKGRLWKRSGSRKRWGEGRLHKADDVATKQDSLCATSHG